MANLQEYRLGNFVRSGKGLYEIMMLGWPSDVYVKSAKDGGFINIPIIPQPVELTADWLEGSGFVLQPWGYVKQIQGQDKGFLISRHFSFEVGNGLRKVVKYVHELQNLYHAITGEELTLSPQFQPLT